LWTIPEPGDVLAYSYLWHREAMAGQEEGLKDRPVVVVVAQQIVNGRVKLLVAPVTHSAPVATTDSIEMPQSVKAHLGLDRERSWIVATELNQFVWPGPDVRVAPKSEDQSPLIGAIPEWLFERLRAAIQLHAGARKMGVVKRTQ
jgi:hypothetical protein